MVDEPKTEAYNLHENTVSTKWKQCVSSFSLFHWSNCVVFRGGGLQLEVAFLEGIWWQLLFVVHKASCTVRPA